MPLELEIKLHVDSHEPVRARLRSGGAKLRARVVETNHVFDRPDGSLRRSGFALRIRELAPGRPTGGTTDRPEKTRVPVGPDNPDASYREEASFPSAAADYPTTLTLKGPRRHSVMKSREELEIRVHDGAAAKQILNALGFVSILRYQKRRETWKLGPCKIELDEPPHIGLFVEIEGPDEETIRAIQRDLGLGGLPHHKPSYVHMLMAYCAEHGIADGVVDLPE